MSTTPMMEQYNSIKAQYQDAVLFFRLGDFYEMFNDDALVVSKLLNLTLTKRGGCPMCGIPYHAAKIYISRLLKFGKKIAICEQTHDPIPGQLTERKVIEVITPGTTVEDSLLDGGQNNYLLGVYCSTLKTGDGDYWCALAYIDVSTGDFFATRFPKRGFLEKFKKEFDTVCPNELLIQQSLLNDIPGLDAFLNESPEVLKNYYPDWSFGAETAEKKLCMHFHVQNLKAFGLDAHSPEVPIASLLLEYLSETAGGNLRHIVSIKLYSDSQYLLLDDASRKNLELVTNLRDATSSYTLLEVLNQTKTALGIRKLKEEILHPLCDADEIRARQAKVESLYKNESLLAAVRQELASVLDIQRLVSKLTMNKANGKDLLSLKQSLKQIIALQQISQKHNSFFLHLTEAENNTLQNSVDMLERSIGEDCSTLLTDGKLIKEGWSAELDEIKSIHNNTQNILNDYLEEEREKTGIKKLHIKYNKMHGYFLEVTKYNLTTTPEHFKLLKDLKMSKFFSTDKLNAIEEKIESAESKIAMVEKKLFYEVVETVVKDVELLLSLSKQIAMLDVLQSFAQAAVMYYWVRPTITTDGVLDIVDGRHPVVEAHLPQGEFIPNDLKLCSGADIQTAGSETAASFALITGPNMAGKSTFLRQNALIVLLAQMGSFVPASKASVSVCDKIFCRVGASDNLARGESTFLVEMTETAFILQNATENSLVIMDEVGRGTSTQDGLAIAQAVSEYLLNNTKAKTLFATHYHELGALQHPSMVHLKLDVAEEKQSIVFLKKVVPGISENSYGLHVAKLAGIPQCVIDRAVQLLGTVETGKVQSDQDFAKAPLVAEANPKQKGLFPLEETIVDEIAQLDLNRLTGIEALQLLHLWQNEIK